jgi:hypothetical protein
MILNHDISMILKSLQTIITSILSYLNKFYFTKQKS